MAEEKTQNMPPVPTTVPIADSSTGTTTVAWLRWFITLRNKLNVINDKLLAWSGVSVPTGITPGQYGDASHYPKVTLDEHGWVIAVSEQAVAGTFTGLSDTPDSYTGQSGKSVIVNTAETALEFGVPPGGGLNIDNVVALYSDLAGLVTSVPLGAGDAGYTVLNSGDGLLYVWDGSAFPSSGAGVSNTAHLRVIAEWDYASDGTQTSPLEADISNLSEFQVLIDSVTSAATSYRSLQWSNDGGSSWQVGGYQFINASGSVVTSGLNALSLASIASSNAMTTFSSTVISPSSFSLMLNGQILSSSGFAFLMPVLTPKINRIRVHAWTAGGSMSNLTGGKIAIIGR